VAGRWDVILNKICRHPHHASQQHPAFLTRHLVYQNSARNSHLDHLSSARKNAFELLKNCHTALLEIDTCNVKTSEFWVEELYIKNGTLTFPAASATFD
jgi:hypothetical protein